jgi:hypothetical protein
VSSSPSPITFEPVVDIYENQSTWNYGLLYADRSSKDEQLLIK